MAFLMADLQRGVWAKAKEVPADPVEDAQPAAQGGEAADKVLSGEEEWHIFSPKQIDARRCLARTWNSGQGGQCEEARSGCSLCYKHQRMAVSTVGLSYGLVDGPIPEHRLAQFREAALRGVTSAPGRKRAERESEPPKPKRKKGKKMRKLKPKPKDAKLPKEKPKEKASKDKESKSEQPQRVRQPIGSQRAMKESTKEEKRGRPKKSTSTPTEPVKEPEVRSRRFLQSMNEAELQKRNRQKWSSVDVAMDQALQQMDLESRGPFQGLTDKGTIPLPRVGKAVEMMTTTSLEQRLQFTMVLRKSMHHNLQFGSAFVNAGGVTALRGWLQDALPAKQNGKEQLRKHEAVVLEALGLLQTLPVTLQTLRASGIGRTLMAIRNYCAPAMADAGELVPLGEVNRWMKKFRTELMQTKAKAKPEASAAKPPAEVTVRPVVPPASALVRPAPMSTSSASSSAVRPVPVHPAQPLRVAVPARRPAFRTRMLTRKRDRERKAVNETEATLQQLFLLGKVLEDDDGVKTYDICDD
ncbi:unnamed protein product [Effrenium voratum]|uniref:TFIIS N-terminal domain-containing protein n=1 Tax=Effrenium voratum TaxID=2562239 RepID=A0AA36NCH2_9DINO|nr:unnamed protein product [Effrenium voratum]